MKKIFRMICAVMMITALFSVHGFMCYGEAAGEDAEGSTITELHIEEFEEDMYVGDTQSLTITTYPADADASKIQYKSSNSVILSVTESGRITAHKVGKAKVMITGGEVKETLSITVREKTDAIVLNAEQISLKPGEAYQIEARAYPQSASQSFSYKSTNTDVAGVSKKGIIQGIREGHASILVSNDVLMETIFVMVNNESEKVDFSDATGEKDKSKEETGKAEVKSKTRLSTAELKSLKGNNEYREWQYEGYKVRIEGKNVVNPKNSFNSQIEFQTEGEDVTFVVNEGNPLPGNFQITFENSYRSYEYLYLYNQALGKYQKLQYDNGNGTIEISEAGTYLLTNNPQEKWTFSLWLVGGTAVTIIVIGAIYILLKRKYWFW